jgi:hypothetical protein
MLSSIKYKFHKLHDTDMQIHSSSQTAQLTNQPTQWRQNPTVTTSPYPEPTGSTLHSPSQYP